MQHRAAQGICGYRASIPGCRALQPERLVVLLGLSPGVLHSVLCAWRRVLSKDARVVLVATRRDVAKRAVELASKCPCPGLDAPPLRDESIVETFILERGDVDSLEALEELRSLLGSLGLGTRDAVDVTGGRKLASVAAAIYASSHGALVGYTLIPSEEYQRIARSGGRGCGEETVRTEPRLITL